MRIRRIIVPSVTVCFLLTSFFLSLGTVIFSATAVLADSRYVIPSAEVVLKSGAGREYRVIGVVKDGDSVEFLEEDGSYAMVRLANGKEGWMLKRYLSVQPPPSTIVASLRAENEKLKQKELELSQQFSEVSANLDKAKNDLNSVLSEKKQVATDYQNLQQDTADVIKIKEDMLKATQQNEVLTQEITALKEENDKLNKDKAINWFMAGGGVLLLGMVLGNLSSKSRKRKSSLL
ncbi:TIGR04211 family SH3 domain-containing protein [Desulfopila sp. IMCC35006]|uniref:TIGR04211 family SH3 domain-containing protein n=1 Tax=Desulfopila sp. IMCC35006 TaxID=2569542 RepID=UPI0010AC9D7F|nr:TIGR04211 family SH3 domain-containing protein [Desulfopila sp. IMCC35006]TKB24122.1 TIGR04211 family SH3 domain-containing protein [Desulfopila sp. IMCC35006]